MSITYQRRDDGVTHINIYSKGETELGRLLSNFAHTPFVHPSMGTFASMEGFYYYVSSGEQFDAIRELSGYNAKQFGKTLPRVTRTDFDAVLQVGLASKYLYHRDLFDTLFAKAVDDNGEPLPFAHYYLMGTVGEKVVVPKGSQWLIDGWANIRANAMGL